MSKKTEMTFDRLQREKEEAAIATNCPNIMENLAKVKANLLKVQEMRTVMEQRLIELPSLIAANIKKFNSVSPEDIPVLSRERTSLEAEQSEITAQVDDIKGRVIPSLGEEKKELKLTLAKAAVGFLRIQRESVMKELFEVLLGLAEPVVDGWERYYDAISREYGLSGDFNTWKVLRELEVYSPILAKIFDKYGQPNLIRQAETYRNSKLTPAGASVPVAQK